MHISPTRRFAQGPLTFGPILRHALGMLRFGSLRVAVVALVLFVPPALVAGPGNAAGGAPEATGPVSRAARTAG